MPKRWDYRYVDRNWNPITKAVYDKYAKNDWGYIQYFDWKNRWSTKISWGKYTAPEPINTSDLSYSIDDVNAIREKYWDMAVDEYSNILDVNPNKIWTSIGKDKEYIPNSTLWPRASQQASTWELTNVFPWANISFGNSSQWNNNTWTNLTWWNNTTIDFAGNNNINTTSTWTPNPKTNDTVITQQVPNTKPNKNPTSNNVPKNNSNSNNRSTMTNRRKRAIAPDGSTQIGYTQEEFNQRLKDYEMEDQALNERKAQQANLRSQTIGNGNMTRDQLFKDALNKFASNPDGFTAEQRTALYNAGKQLGYYNDTMLDNWVQKPADTVEPTAAGSQVQAQPQSNNNIKQWGWSNFIWYV